MDCIANNIDFSPLHQRMQWYVDENILPHLFSLVMRGTDVLDYRCFGYMDVESKTPLRDDAIYRLASNTKLITSVAAMMLYEEGAFKLDDPLSDYIPAFAELSVLVAGATALDQVEAAKTPITPRQLLNHTSGLSYGFVEPESLIDQTYMANGLNVLAGISGNLAELCDRLGALPLAFQPGTQWRYSFATDVTAHLVEVLSGQRYDDFLRQRIFEPLGMSDTGFCVSADKLERLPAMYIPGDFLDPMAPGPTLMSPGGDAGASRLPAFLSGGGGLFSSAADYVTFLRLLINDGEWAGVRLLKAETLQMMRTNQLVAGMAVKFPMWDMTGNQFGLGFAVKDQPAAGEPDSALGEYHWGGIAGTHSWISPGAGISGFCGTQVMPGFWHPYSHDFKRLAYELAG